MPIERALTIAILVGVLAAVIVVLSRNGVI